MSENTRANLASLEAAYEKLQSFKAKVLGECDTLEGAASSAGSFCQDNKSQLAISKLQSSIADIRNSLDAVQPVLEKIMEISDDVKAAQQVEM